MIYLIETPKYYKIGYTKDIESRMKLYSTYNKEFELKDLMEGDMSLETLLHNLCSEYLYETEWFYKTSEVLLIWNICKTFNKQFCKRISFLEEENKKLQTEVSILKLKNIKLDDDFDRVEKIAKDVIKHNKELMKELILIKIESEYDINPKKNRIIMD